MQGIDESYKLDIRDINYFDCTYNGYIGSNKPLAMFSRSIVSNDGTGNILEISTNS